MEKEEANECIERVKPNVNKIFPRKCPVHVLEKEGKPDWHNLVIREPFNHISDILQHLTATIGAEHALNIIQKGVSAFSGGNETERFNLAFQTLADFAPKDSTEARLCMQAGALYSQGMSYLRRAENNDMLCHCEHYMKNAMKLLHLHNETIEALNKHRRGGEQRVVVQYVQVNDGGKAVVGGAFKGGGENKKTGEVPHGYSTDM